MFSNVQQVRMKKRPGFKFKKIDQDIENYA